ncbi:P-loop containing nucleoside triphosphate hydrolase protein [Podospora fimiseda]|uniref:P-loop containing nucleoside triphosphate hydrolase protein n=1 Tax=Podospora fimiseda TaxID=252190 RepID=A0AAN6YR05_9PEZI|nr:P-loop containing nucleoside triphosphate hydrolase protein [Podospora fimiseda]
MVVVVSSGRVHCVGCWLLILLHGGPGTGKTLTAESIAETQGRPLYRVTCGDVGIEPTEVEKVSKQKQNAIVSVFLRLLEHYDGILVLTTNRVGTFDEAFNSRIHFALRYYNLDEEQRVEIWRNFIRMLAKTKERIDIQDLEMNVNKLAQVELNGRQIRNVIILARSLARFRKQMLVYKHVQDAFASVVKFDEYLLELRGSDDRWATEQRLR